HIQCSACARRNKPKTRSAERNDQKNAHGGIVAIEKIITVGLLHNGLILDLNVKRVPSCVLLLRLGRQRLAIDLSHRIHRLTAVVEPILGKGSTAWKRMTPPPEHES